MVKGEEMIKTKKIRKHSKRPLPKLKKEAWDLWSLCRRKLAAKKAARNGYVQCISCGKWIHWKESQLGHYLHGVMDFNPVNTNIQCRQCNGFRKGNPIGYAKWLVLKYGQLVLEELDQGKIEERRKGKVYERSDYADMIKTFKEKLADLEA